MCLSAAVFFNNLVILAPSVFTYRGGVYGWTRWGHTIVKWLSCCVQLRGITLLNFGYLSLLLACKEKVVLRYLENMTADCVEREAGSNTTQCTCFLCLSAHLLCISVQLSTRFHSFPSCFQVLAHVWVMQRSPHHAPGPTNIQSPQMHQNNM